MKHPHVVLGVSPGASKEEIRCAYHRLCLKLHPDVSPPDQKKHSECLLKQVTEAYAILSKGHGAARVPQGSYYGSGASSGSGSSWGGYKARTRVSNRVVALIIAVPLILTGIKVGMVFGDPSKQGEGSPNLWNKQLKGYKGRAQE